MGGISRQTWLFALLIGPTETPVLAIHHLLYGPADAVAQILHCKPVYLLQLDPAFLLLKCFVGTWLCSIWLFPRDEHGHGTQILEYWFSCILIIEHVCTQSFHQHRQLNFVTPFVLVVPEVLNN